MFSFMKTEIESGGVCYVKSNFVNEYLQRKQKSQHFIQPTANDFYSGTTGENKVKSSCVFCNKL